MTERSGSMIRKSSANQIELVELMIVCEHTKRSTHGLLPTITEKPKRTFKFQHSINDVFKLLATHSMVKEMKTMN